MLNEVTAEMFKLSKDSRFIRNLSLTFIMVIAGLLMLSDLQKQNTAISEATRVTNISHSQTKLVVERK